MSPNVRPKGCTNFKTRQLARLLSRHYDAELAKAGIKTTQFSLLTHVVRLEPIAPSDLARRMGLDASTLTRNLRPLVSEGWLVQDAGADARSRLIRVTEAGRVKQGAASAHWAAAQRKVNDLMGNERVAALHALIDDFTAALDEALPVHSPEGESP